MPSDVDFTSAVKSKIDCRKRVPADGVARSKVHGRSAGIIAEKCARGNDVSGLFLSQAAPSEEANQLTGLADDGHCANTIVIEQLIDAFNRGILGNEQR